MQHSEIASDVQSFPSRPQGMMHRSVSERILEEHPRSNASDHADYSDTDRR